MTQAPQQAPVPAPKPAPATAPAAAPASQAATKTVDVPRLLNKWQLIAVSACILFAVVTAALQVLGWQANRAAADNTEQLVRVQNIQSTLFRADALATTSFLVGGLEDPARRAAYDDAIDQVTRQITEAAQAQPADSEVLSALNSAVNRYTTTNTQARDNNRQGFPVGAEYLRGASNQLRADALPLLDALTQANSTRAQDELSGQVPVLMVLPGLAALFLLWWVNTQLAKTFRRRFNVGIAAAFIAVAALTVVAGAVSSSQNNGNGDLRNGSFRVAINEATARTAANDAKSNESRRLGAQGSGAIFEEGWQAAAMTVYNQGSPQTLGLWDAYANLHVQVVALEEGGKYDEAVALATTLDPNGPTATLDAFDKASQELVSQMATQTTDALRSGNTIFLILAGLTLLLGFGAAGLATWGIAQRRREYS